MIIEEQAVDVIYLQNLMVSDAEKRVLCYNIEHGINTTDGLISVKCFIDNGNPLEPIEISLPLKNIYEIESIELR